MVIKTDNELNLGPITSRRKLMICLVTGITSLSVLIFLLFVNPIPVITRWNMKITKGSQVHEYLKLEQECMRLSVYLFNITNAQQFMAGEDHRVKVEEVGPFTYLEVRKNENLEVDDEAHEIRYSPRITVVFQPHLSIGHPKDFNVTMPNMPMLGMTSLISTYPYWTRMTYNLLTSQLSTKPLVTVNVHDYLWGYREPLVTLGNSLAPGVISFAKVGLLDRFYKNSSSRLVLSSRDEDKFMIKTRNGSNKLYFGNGDPGECTDCESLQDAYEAILFPLPMTPDTKIRVFKEGLCKIVDVTYNDTRTLDNGAEALVYRLSDKFFNVDPNNTYGGLVDLSECFFGAPVAFSKGHLVDVNPKLYERVDGINPDDEKHEGYLLIEPLVGFEMDTYINIQLNMVLGDLSFNSKSSVFSDMLLPVGYIKFIQPELKEETKQVIYQIYVFGPITLLCSKLLLFLTAFILISCSIRLIRCDMKCRKKVYLETEQVKKAKVFCAEEPLMRSEKAL